MRLRIAIPEHHVSAPVLDAGLEAVTRLNEALIRSGESPMASEALKMGMRWRPEPPGEERFDHGALLAGRGHGDCDDWAPLHAASLRVTGRDPGAVARVVKSGPSRWHAVVQRSDGKIDDPSVWAGMQVAGGAPPSVCAPMFAPDPNKPQIASHQTVAGTYRARADLPWVGGTGHALSCVVGARDPYEALMGAMRGVCVAGHVAAVAEPLALAKLTAIEALMRGARPADVEASLRQQFPELATVAGILANHAALQVPAICKAVVGDFFGDLVSAAAPIAGGALGGPLGAAAGAGLAGAIKSQGGGGGGGGGFVPLGSLVDMAQQRAQQAAAPAVGPAGGGGFVMPGGGGCGPIIVRF